MRYGEEYEEVPRRTRGKRLLELLSLLWVIEGEGVKVS